MTNYTLPTHTKISSVTIRQVHSVKITSSPFSSVQQTLDYGGQRWEADIELPPMKHTDARQWLAFLSKLKGGYHTFTMGDPYGVTARGTAGGTPLVAGASQTGASLNIDGASVSQTGWLKSGDYIQLGTDADARMYMVMDDVTTDAAGAATLSLWPDIVTAPADNASVVISSPVCAWRLSSPINQWDVNNSAIYGIRFSAVGVVG